MEEKVVNRDDISYRLAQQDDCDTIAALHAHNWKEHYRGLCPDEYLDKEVDLDRLKIWRKRFEKKDATRHLVVAINENEKIIGFVCSFLDYHPLYGAYLDNLHVLSEYQGIGLGRILMNKAAEWIASQRAESTIYLHVLKGNTAAINFYEKINGKKIREYMISLPWGGKGLVIDYIWNVNDLQSNM